MWNKCARTLTTTLLTSCLGSGGPTFSFASQSYTSYGPLSKGGLFSFTAVQRLFPYRSGQWTALNHNV